MRPLLIAGAVVLALTGCSHQLSPTSHSTQSSPAHSPDTSSASSASTAAPVSSGGSAADLSNLDATLATVDGAVNQSQSDLSAGDASAAKNDDQ